MPNSERMEPPFLIASEEDILSGKTTDIYFQRTEKILRTKDKHNKVILEVTVSSISDEWNWCVFAGLKDAAKLLSGKPLDMYALNEGTIFSPLDVNGIRVPTMVIKGDYTEFAIFETPLLGFLCPASGMTTAAARIRRVAADKRFLSFGARRAHPSISPLVSYCAYIGGADGISCVKGAELLNIPSSGTMPHSLVIIFEDHISAWTAFDEILGEDVPRIILTDTYLDEVAEALLAAKTIPNLYGVRLDTTGSRKGNFAQIAKEVRWELDVRGFSDVKIFVSGGLDEKEIEILRDAGVDGFGVGGFISNAPTVDYALDIVSKMKNQTWEPCAKRGKFSGAKSVWQCESCLAIEVSLEKKEINTCSQCQGKMKPALVQIIEQGKIVHRFETPLKIRDRVLHQLDLLR